MKQILRTLPLITLFYFIFSSSAAAFLIQSGQDITLPKTKNINETVIIAGRNLTVDANISGDLICAGQNITVNGAVQGSIICAGQSLQINGPVAGNIRLAGQTLDISKTANIKGDILAVSQDLSLSSTVGKDVLLAGEKINVLPTVKIGGNFDYYVKSADTASVSAASVKGKLTQHLIPQPTAPTQDFSQIKQTLSVTSKIISFFSVLIVGLFLLIVFKPSIILDKSSVKLFFLGFAVIFLTPILFTILFLTVIGIPLAFILLLVYLLGFLVAIPLASIAIGQLIHPNRFISLLIGTTLFTMLSLLPLLGWFFGLIFLCLGFGLYSQFFITKKQL
jgi:hypothetical protein